MPPRTRQGETSHDDLLAGVRSTAEVTGGHSSRSAIIDRYPSLIATVKESWESGQGFAYGPFDTEDEARKVQALVRLAARKLGCGLAGLKVTEDNRVEFKAQDKRSYAGTSA